MFRLSLVVECAPKDSMRQWIKSLKNSVDATQKTRDAQDAKRNRDISVIQVKGAEFWQRLIVCLQTDARELKAQFPNDASYGVSVQSLTDGKTVTLKRNTFPQIKITATLEPELLRVHIVEERMNDHASIATTPSSEDMRISVDSNDVLHFEYRQHDILMPEDLADQFLAKDI